MTDDTKLILLRAIAPHFTKVDRTKIDYSDEYYSLALINGIPLTYLESLQENLKQKISVYKKHTGHLRKLMEEIIHVSTLLERQNIDYAVFKTIRPYPEDTTDIDILNMENDNISLIVKTFTKEGYRILEKGPYTITFRSPNGVDVDVYNELNANWLIYIDKRVFRGCTKEVKLQNGYTRLLSSEADQLIMIAHSVIKESYNLGHFLTTLYYLQNDRKEFTDKLVSLSIKNKLTIASRWYFTLSFLLCRDAYPTLIPEFIEVLYKLGGPHPRAYGVYEVQRFPPYTIDYFTLINVLKEKLDEPLFRRSLSNQLMRSTLQNKLSVGRIIRRVLSIIRVTHAV